MSLLDDDVKLIDDKYIEIIDFIIMDYFKNHALGSLAERDVPSLIKEIIPIMVINNKNNYSLLDPINYPSEYKVNLYRIKEYIIYCFLFKLKNIICDLNINSIDNLYISSYFRNKYAFNNKPLYINKINNFGINIGDGFYSGNIEVNHIDKCLIIGKNIISTKDYTTGSEKIYLTPNTLKLPKYNKLNTLYISDSIAGEYKICDTNNTDDVSILGIITDIYKNIKEFNIEELILDLTINKKSHNKYSNLMGDNYKEELQNILSIYYKNILNKDNQIKNIKINIL